MRLVMAWGSNYDEQIYWSWTVDGTNWSEQKAIPRCSTSHTSALAALGKPVAFWLKPPCGADLIESV